jgi:hypothetical protein
MNTCNICHKDFSRKDSLVHHKLTHKALHDPVNVEGPPGIREEVINPVNIEGPPGMREEVINPLNLKMVNLNVFILLQ